MLLFNNKFHVLLPLPEIIIILLGRLAYHFSASWLLFDVLSVRLIEQERESRAKKYDARRGRYYIDRVIGE